MDNESIRNFVMLELVSPENPADLLISKEEAEEVFKRYRQGSKDWEHVFEPIKDGDFRQKMIDLYKIVN